MLLISKLKRAGKIHTSTMNYINSSYECHYHAKVPENIYEENFGMAESICLVSETCEMFERM